MTLESLVIIHLFLHHRVNQIQVCNIWRDIFKMVILFCLYTATISLKLLANVA